MELSCPSRHVWIPGYGRLIDTNPVTSRVTGGNCSPQEILMKIRISEDRNPGFTDADTLTFPLMEYTRAVL